MLTSASDQDLLERQAALQAKATQVLAELDLGQLFADVGPVLVVGSYLSGLMCWRDLDVCLLADVDCSPSDVLELLKRVVELPGFVGFTYRDERGARCPTGEARDERYHVPFDLDAGHGRWRIDLSLFLRDLHGHVADWHTQLRDTITDEQRLAVLRIKDVWHRLPSYPDEVSGWEIYTAVLVEGVRTLEQFARCSWPTASQARTRPRRLQRLANKADVDRPHPLPELVSPLLGKCVKQPAVVRWGLGRWRC
jgi:hypothetical protein